MKRLLSALLVSGAVVAGAAEPTTRPATTATATTADVAELRREVARLRAEVAELRKELAAGKPKAAVTVANWRDHLKVGMTEGEADRVFEALPRGKNETFQKKVIEVNETGKAVTWTATASGQRTVINNRDVGLPPKVVRLCTIIYENGRVVEIRF